MRSVFKVWLGGFLIGLGVSMIIASIFIGFGVCK